jgi:hypothetical protein
MARLNTQEEKFATDREVLDAFHYLAQDVIRHPLVISPKPLTFKMTLVRGGDVVDMGWDTPESGP